MYIRNLVCTDCGKEWSPGFNYHCPDCDGILMVDYCYEQMDKKIIERALKKANTDIWHYRDLLPIENENNTVSLREGGTPLLKLENLAVDYDFTSTFVKDETRNPTGSFKDRPTSVGISKAIELGAKIVTIASSGNGAASVASYAAKAGVKSVIFVPESTPLGKVTQAVTYGAEIIKVKGNYSNSYKLALEASTKFQWANLTSTFLNPYTLEGDKTVAYELYFQLNGEVPDYIIIPIAAGPLLYGIYKGFIELKKLGFVDKIPSMVGVQAEQCSPIVQAFERRDLNVEAKQNGPTIASGIADPLIGYEKDGNITLKAIYESNGMAVSVSEKEIVEAVLELGRREGLYGEPAAATAWAGYKKLLGLRKIARNALSILILTGNGLKQPIVNEGKDKDIPIIDPILSELEKQRQLQI